MVWLFLYGRRAPCYHSNWSVTRCFENNEKNGANEVVAGVPPSSSDQKLFLDRRIDVRWNKVESSVNLIEKHLLWMNRHREFFFW